MQNRLFVDEQGVDIEVEILEYINQDSVKVRSKVGWPFGGDGQFERIELTTQNEKVVKKDQVKVI